MRYSMGGKAKETQQYNQAEQQKEWLAKGIVYESRITH
ncbi:hypothetical protein PORCRE_1089 [Porphyromonas crevioricanis JCM 15906]|uniref:Uncharacterized protein n=1 Tax=Porphyromonas crevioricanis JCM 15906 TaxID=1305617 RepID=T1DSR3_9PORP|nr:hypothetical protein PORCRE_1089 [Porphyromonas crevioricanis JCM 15906]GAD07613.1 hypothetical protein PORCAN_1235 [Porphyromonas crevioricanis JCM 13913]